MKHIAGTLVCALALVIAAAFMPQPAEAAGSSATVTFTSSTEWGFNLLNRKVTATSGLVEKYYPDIEESSGVTAGDVLVAAHIQKYGKAFTNDPTEFMEIVDSDYGAYAKTIFGKANMKCYINNKAITTSISDTVVSNNAKVQTVTFSTGDTSWSAQYTYFSKETYRVNAGNNLDVKLRALSMDSNWNETLVGAAPTADIMNVKNGRLCSFDSETDSNGVAKISFSNPGTYTISAVGEESHTMFCPVATVKVGLNTPKAKMKKKTGTGATISWSAVKGARQYKVYRSTSKNGKYRVVKTTSKRSWSDSKLRKGRHYYYKVFAFRGSIHSKSSSILVK
ncbi:MAG: hypothetical protein ACOYJH_04190 [Anaerovoracaceae bacterium]|jgi:hypothetical protein